MERTMTMGEINFIAGELYNKWEQYRTAVVLTAKNMYNLIKLKETILNEAKSLQETIMMLAEKHGGKVGERGQIEVPDDGIEDMNKDLKDLTDQEVTIAYNPIIIYDNANSVPVDLMELLLDFIEIAD